MIVYPIREERTKTGTDDGAHHGGAAAQNSVFVGFDCSNSSSDGSCNSHDMNNDNSNSNNNNNDNNSSNNNNNDNSSSNDMYNDDSSSSDMNYDGGKDNSDSEKGAFPLRIQYCPVNPCITRIVHRLHRQILDGVEGADVELNRYLTVCSFLSQHSNSEDAEDVSGSSPCTWEARIILDCVCGSEAHAIRLTKRAYQQQFRLGRRCRFLCLAATAAGGLATVHTAHHKRLAAATATRPLHIPLQALIPPRHVALQHSLLPDLGASMRMVLQRRLFTEHSRKQWVKAASNIQVQAILLFPLLVVWQRCQNWGCIRHPGAIFFIQPMCL